MTRGQFGAALALSILFISACRTSAPASGFGPEEGPQSVPPESTLVYSIFLIGDAADPLYEGADGALGLLDSMLAATGERSAVVFLGDNISPSGLPPASDTSRQAAEGKIDKLLDVVAGHSGRIVVIPGNHDWGGQGLGGDRDAVLRQEDYIESRLDQGNTFLPDDGFPGPMSVKVADDIVIVALDTQWWLEDHKPFGYTGTYDLEIEGEFLLELDDVLRRHSDKHVVVVGHHPMFSSGEHGGFFSGARSLLSGERFARGYLGAPQDFSNLKYRRMREAFLAIFQHHRHLVYASGHERNLQYFRRDDQHYVVSGAGSKLSHVERGGRTRFVEEAKGFGGLEYYTDGSIWLRFFAPGDDGKAKVLATHLIRSGDQQLPARSQAEDAGGVPAARDSSLQSDSTQTPETVVGGVLPAYGQGNESLARASDSPAGSSAGALPYAFASRGTVEVAANENYGRKGLAAAILGKHYRDVWAMTIPVPVIDLQRTAGGLTPIQKGGGLQTTSLRLEGADGDQYVLRSIDKDPTRTIPEYLRETIAEDVVKDQIAAMHPYGAFMIPQLAEAAGVYHTRPLLVYIPDDPSLGHYRSVFGGMLALFESRPDEDQSDEARFGFAENVIGTPKLIEEIEEDNDERVDQRAFARARLFDMFIGDWDRHRDQWRWAEFDVTPGKIYRPIPRDRDFAFFRFDGFVPNLVKRTGNVRFRRFTNFYRPYDDMLGLNLNGSEVDRRFASSLGRSDWIEIADSLRMSLTDDAIDRAVRDLPVPIYDHHGESIAALLRDRREGLPEAASRYFDILVRTVEIVGSDKHERFEVRRLSDDSTLVILYKTVDGGVIDREFYRRTIYTSETKEIQLFGLGGNDYFKVTGAVGRGPRVRAVGGRDEDTFVDSSTVSGSGRYTIFHDTEAGNEWLTGVGTRIMRSNDPNDNRYAMTRFEFDERHPLLHLTRNKDDGFLLGGGAKILTRGFRKVPYAAQHRIMVTAATNRIAVNAHYRGHYVDLLGTWDGHFVLDALSDRRYRSFYGFGNETELDVRNLYHARLGRITLEPGISKDVLPNTSVQLGPRFDFVNIEESYDADVQPTRFDDAVFVDKYFAGVQIAFNVDGLDTLAATQHGARWLNTVSANVGVRHTTKRFVRLASEISYFNTYYHPAPFTIGVRFGGATNIGGFEFFQANTLGGRTNLRGFRKTRFSGRTAAFSNLEIRVPLADFNAYLTRGLAGVLAFVDHGRVWSGEDHSILSGWHRGYGGGLWVAPFNQFAFTATVGRSEENTLFDITFGFQF